MRRDSQVAGGEEGKELRTPKVTEKKASAVKRTAKQTS
jgi:hypothetical protein